jgi:hypothetical protein
MATNTSGELNLTKPELTDKIQTTIADLATNFDTIDDSVSNKVDKVTGKGLSTEDYTSAEKAQVAKVGDLDALTTTEKSNLVGSINEVVENLDAHKAENVTEFATTNQRITDLTANEVAVEDIGRHYTTHTVEEVLDEVGSELRDVTFTTHTQDSSIKSLPIGTIDEDIDNFEAEGLTLVNSVKNGDFSDGTTGWTSLGATLSVSGGNLLITGSNSSYPRALIKIANTIDSSVKIFAYAKLKATNLGQTVSINLYDNTSYKSAVSTSVTGGFIEVYKIFTGITTISETRIGLVNNIDTPTTEVMEVDGNAGVFAINMTALGIEDYTEEQMLDLVRGGYFEGVKSVENPKVESVGKNLFDGQLESGTYSAASGQKAAYASVVRTVNKFRVKENTEYTLDSSVYNLDLILFYDSVGELISVISTSMRTRTFTTPAGCRKIAFTLLTTETGTSVQLEEGTTATAYEPYKSSHLTADVTLRRLPNGVKDRVYEDNGQMWLEKNVEEYVLQSGDISISSNSGYDYQVLNVPLTKFIGIKPQENVVDNNVIVEGFPKENSGGVEFIEYNTEPYKFQTNTDRLILVVPLGTYASLAEAQADLSGTKILYQLATPELINLTEQGLVEGELMSYANGTVYNTSDTFHGSTNFDVVTSRKSQVQYLLDEVVDLDSVKADKVQEDWITPTLLNGWVNFDTNSYAVCQYFKDNIGIVHARGFIKSGTIGSTIFNFPAGYRPDKNHYFTAYSNDSVAQITLSSVGDLKCRLGNNTYVAFYIHFKGEV